MCQVVLWAGAIVCENKDHTHSGFGQSRKVRNYTEELRDGEKLKGHGPGELFQNELRISLCQEMVTVKLEPAFRSLHSAFRSHGALALYSFTANYVPWTHPPKGRRRTRKRRRGRKKNSGRVETRKTVT